MTAVQFTHNAPIQFINNFSKLNSKAYDILLSNFPEACTVFCVTISVFPTLGKLDECTITVMRLENLCFICASSSFAVARTRWRYGSSRFPRRITFRDADKKHYFPHYFPYGSFHYEVTIPNVDTWNTKLSIL